MPRPRTLVLAAAVALFGAAHAPAQSRTIEGMQWFDDWLRSIDQNERKQTADIARDFKALLDTMRAERFVAEARMKARDGQFDAAIRTYEASLAEYTGPKANSRDHRNAVLALAWTNAAAGHYDAAAAGVRRAERIAPARGGQAIRDALEAGRLLLVSDRVFEAEKYARAARFLCDSLPPDDLERDLIEPDYHLLRATLDNRAGAATAARAAAAEACRRYEKASPADLFPNGTPELTEARVQCAAALIALRQGPEAEGLLKAAAADYVKRFPAGHPAAVEILRLTAGLHRLRGAGTKAAAALTTARETIERLFPTTSYKDGHPELFRTWLALAEEFTAAGSHADAVALTDKAVTVGDRFYPAGHEWRVVARLGSARALAAAGRTADALATATAALDQTAALPATHPLRPTARVLVGDLLGRAGRKDDARRELELAIHDMPPDHPRYFDAACVLGRVALVGHDADRAAQAFAAALAADAGQVDGMARAAAEIEVLTFARSRHVALAGLLAATSGRPATDADTYAHAWAAKGAVTRLALARRAAVRAATSAEVAALLADLRDCRARLRRALLEAREPTEADRLADRCTELEAALQPVWAAAARDAPAFADVAAELPPAVAFVDLFRTTPPVGKPQYTAFVLRRGGVTRVDLGEATTIDGAVLGWRDAVENWKAGHPPPDRKVREDDRDTHGARLRDRVWRPLAAALAGVDVVAVAPDGALAQIPFAALPGDRPGELLIDRYAFTTVPHGAYLVAGRSVPTSPPTGFLAMGAVDFGPGELESLAASVEGLEAARRWGVAAGAVTLEGPAATKKALTTKLPHARQAHLATHGYFKAEKYRDDAAAGGPGRQFPLSYSGLACASANTPGDDVVLSGDEIAQLPLDGLQLAMLGACESGLGAAEAGEGLAGLQRAFHLAGCPNVVASLWKIDDAATRDWSHAFYDHLWARRLDSVAAVRAAQQDLRRTPGYAHPKYWAAFVHSGRGAAVPVPGGGGRPWLLVVAAVVGVGAVGWCARAARGALHAR